eukprot:GHRQ01031333.1.p2 GENE.GHRQ01031333.1~~GHRQ01031333.1.p2  ORF type:complete len:270 (+),score=129.05 GHRQ01031333.1:652-1461(+)
MQCCCGTLPFCVLMWMLPRRLPLTVLLLLLLLLRAGSLDGKIKVWRISSGQCLRRFDHAHSQGVTCVALSRDGTQVLSGSYDGSVRVHGLKSGKMLKEFRGHTSYVQDVCYNADGSHVISCSSDATVRIWDAKTCEQLHGFRPPAAGGGDKEDPGIHSIQLHPLHPEQIFVSNQSSSLYLMNMSGQVIKAMQSGKREGGDFRAMAVSPRGEWVYALGEDSVLYCFSTAAGKLEHIMQVHEKEAIGVAHHPHRNLVATYAQEGPLFLWKA